MKFAIALLAGMLLAFPASRADAEPVDCEAARCTIQSTIDTECSCADAKNHGGYTSCVSRVVSRLVRDGLVPKKCRTKIKSCAIRSICGKPDGSVACQLPDSAVTSRCRPLSSESACTSRGGTVVASCCASCNAPPVPTATTTATPVPTETSTPAPEATETATPEPVATETATPEPVATETATPEPVVTETATPEPVATETAPQPVATETSTPAPVATETSTPGPVATETATPAPVATETSTPGPVATETATPGPAATETSTPGPVATETAAAATATVTLTPTITATPVSTATATSTPVPTATATGTPVVTATATSTPVLTATRTSTPILTASPTVSPTPGCGNGVVDAGEQCDTAAPAPQCPNSGQGLEVCSVGCKCACPTKVTFTGDASAPESILDTGWTGISHRAPIISNGDVTVNLSCAATQRPCGTCAVSGPIANPHAGAGQLDDQRCTQDSSRKCTTNAQCTSRLCLGGPNHGNACANDSVCPGGTCPLGGACNIYFGSTLPLAAGGVTTCVSNQFAAPVTGTANVETGEAANTALLTTQVFNGLAIDNPCPRCSDAGGINDGANGGICDGGPRVGLPCDANGFVPGRPDFGRTSLDCPPNPGGIIATLSIDLSNATDPVTRTLTASSPNCTGAAGQKCLCDTCNNVSATPCDDNADCPDPPGPIGPLCGGRRCLSGANNGQACTNNTECPGGSCARPGEPTRASGCQDDTSMANTVLECSDTIDSDPADQEGFCTIGPVDQHCSVASGHAQRGCGADVDCGGGGGSCLGPNRRCFLTGGGANNLGTGTLIAVGMEDTPIGDVSNPTLGAVFCVGPTGAPAVNNVAGLPGPARVTIKGTAVGLP